MAEGPYVHVGDLLASVRRAIALADEKPLRPDFREGWMAANEATAKALELLQQEALSDAVRQLSDRRRCFSLFGL
jgi:hypothetical protein